MAKIKYWYGGVKHEAATEKERDEQIKQWQAAKVDPYEGLKHRDQDEKKGK